LDKSDLIYNIILENEGKLQLVCRTLLGKIILWANGWRSWNTSVRREILFSGGHTI